MGPGASAQVTEPLAMQEVMNLTPRRAGDWQRSHPAPTELSPGTSSSSSPTSSLMRNTFYLALHVTCLDLNLAHNTHAASYLKYIERNNSNILTDVTTKE